MQSVILSRVYYIPDIIKFVFICIYLCIILEFLNKIICAFITSLKFDASQLIQFIHIAFILLKDKVSLSMYNDTYLIFMG